MHSLIIVNSGDGKMEFDPNRDHAPLINIICMIYKFGVNQIIMNFLSVTVLFSFIYYFSIFVGYFHHSNA